MIRTTKNIEEATAITHAGVFHADEVFATVIMEEIFMEECVVYRANRLPFDFEKKDTIIYDIGGGKFDHHQKGGNGKRGNGNPYAACGLIWREFGESKYSEFVFKVLDNELFQYIDATDNGIYQNSEGMSVSKLVSLFNPTWNSNQDSDEAFVKACEFARQIFNNTLASAFAREEAKEVVEKAIENTEDFVLVLEKFCPWQGTIFHSTNPKAEDIMFIVFPSIRGGYNIQCVPDKLGGSGQRVPLPENWRGLNGEQLQKVTGVETATFCHPAGFIAGAQTLEDAILLAHKALE